MKRGADWQSSQVDPFFLYFKERAISSDAKITPGQNLAPILGGGLKYF